MTKFEIPRRQLPSIFAPGSEEGPEGDLTQGDDNPRRSEEFQFPAEKRSATLEFLRERFVPRRSAAQCGKDDGVTQDEAVAAMAGTRLVGKPEATKGLEQPISAPIPGKHPAGPISPVCCRSQSHDHQSGIGISEGRKRTGPVFLIAESTDLLPRSTFTPLYKPRASSAFNYPRLQNLKLTGLDWHTFLPGLPHG
jgi:hypothetical protein